MVLVGVKNTSLEEILSLIFASYFLYLFLHLKGF